MVERRNAYCESGIYRHIASTIQIPSQESPMSHNDPEVLLALISQSLRVFKWLTGSDYYCCIRICPQMQEFKATLSLQMCRPGIWKMMASISHSPWGGSSWIAVGLRSLGCRPGLPWGSPVELAEAAGSTLRAQRGPATKISAGSLFNHGGLSITGLLPRWLASHGISAYI